MITAHQRPVQINHGDGGGMVHRDKVHVDAVNLSVMVIENSVGDY